MGKLPLWMLVQAKEPPASRLNATGSTRRYPLIQAEYFQDDDDHDDHSNNVENVAHGYPFAVCQPHFRLIAGLDRRLVMTPLGQAIMEGPNTA